MIKAIVVIVVIGNSSCCRRYIPEFPVEQCIKAFNRFRGHTWGVKQVVQMVAKDKICRVMLHSIDIIWKDATHPNLLGVLIRASSGYHAKIATNKDVDFSIATAFYSLLFKDTCFPIGWCL